MKGELHKRPDSYTSYREYSELITIESSLPFNIPVIF